MLKKILIFLLTLITLISTVACGENESGVGGGGQGEIDNQTVAVDQTKLPEIKLKLHDINPSKLAEKLGVAPLEEDEIL